MRVLVVEDNAKLRPLVARALRDQGYTVDEEEDGAAALNRLSEVAYDAVVLDLMLPGVNGMRVLREARSWDLWTPVLLLTARDGVTDRVAGLDAGADDYLVKPFVMAELLSRVRALVRRGGVDRPPRVGVGPVLLDTATHTATVGGHSVDLSRREFALLEYLMRRPGKVVGRTELFDHVWGGAHDGGSNVLDVYVRYLRDKVDRPHGLHLIQTVRGVGYRFGPSVDDEAVAAPGDEDIDVARALPEGRT